MFNADGRYALRCIDRDWVPKKGLVELLDYLENCNFDFALLLPKRVNPGTSYQVKATIYESNVDKYSHYPCIGHPSGKVYNTKTLKKLRPEKYHQYSDLVYPENFLERDLLQYGALINCNIQIFKNNRNVATLKSSYCENSLKKTFFYPAKTLEICKATVAHVLDYQMNTSDTKEILKFYKEQLYQRLFYYKMMAFNANASYRYGFKPHLITTFECIYWVWRLRNFEKKAFDDRELKRAWKKGFFRDYLLAIKKSLSLDIKYFRKEGN